MIILKGLSAHQRIVTSANFLIDSESQLQAAAGSYAPPPGASAAAAQTSQKARATIRLITDPAPPRKGNNVFRVSLTGPNGTPVSEADVSVTFYVAAMPAMGMAAMTTTSKLTATADGVYQGTGALGSGGSWQVTITALKSGQAIATKQLRVNATGGK